jgi:hypothetical protein
MRVRGAVDSMEAARAADEARVYRQRSGLVADEMADLSQCSGVAGGWVNPRVYTQRGGDVTDEMAEFCGCDGVADG